MSQTFGPFRTSPYGFQSCPPCVILNMVFIADCCLFSDWLDSFLFHKVLALTVAKLLLAFE